MRTRFAILFSTLFIFFFVLTAQATHQKPCGHLTWYTLGASNHGLVNQPTPLSITLGSDKLENPMGKKVSVVSDRNTDVVTVTKDVFDCGSPTTFTIVGSQNGKSMITVFVEGKSVLEFPLFIVGPFLNDSLLRTKGYAEVFAIRNGKAHLIRNPEIFGIANLG